MLNKKSYLFSKIGFVMKKNKIQFSACVTKRIENVVTFHGGIMWNVGFPRKFRRRNNSLPKFEKHTIEITFVSAGSGLRPVETYSRIPRTWVLISFSVENFSRGEKERERSVITTKRNIPRWNWNVRPRNHELATLYQAILHYISIYRFSSK